MSDPRYSTTKCPTEVDITNFVGLVAIMEVSALTRKSRGNFFPG